MTAVLETGFAVDVDRFTLVALAEFGEDANPIDRLLEPITIIPGVVQGEDSRTEDFADDWKLYIWKPEMGSVPCHFVDPQLFDPKNQKELGEARSVCESCPLAAKNECDRMASVNWEHGVWGGNYYRWGGIVKKPRFRPSTESEVPVNPLPPIADTRLGRLAARARNYGIVTAEQIDEFRGYVYENWDEGCAADLVLAGVPLSSANALYDLGYEYTEEIIDAFIGELVPEAV